ncbi:2-phosphosulfolactate phosphatase [Actinoplanes sp. NPDC049548]|uniref:2-phosphosulfolactate phosphatase n=1 Tax=Actinoplanes sp. NPDC049548 TaxID=3155152 RepID=UPI00342EC344
MRRLRFGWGLSGAEAAGADADVVVVVDVLSFTTTLTVAVETGAEVLPYRWADQTAARHAADRDAVLAVGRSVAGPGDISLSPATIRANPPVPRILLPSPNGSTISLLTGARGATVVGAALRNFSAVARWIARTQARAVAVIAAGEKREDGSLRLADEDLWGAGAVITSLRAAEAVDVSPEAEVAAAAYAAVEQDLPAALHACESGRELIEMGFAHDVDIAAEVDRCLAVPVLTGDLFVGQSASLKPSWLASKPSEA